MENVELGFFGIERASTQFIVLAGCKIRPARSLRHARFCRRQQMMVGLA
jgi:hypothetical protein